MNACIEHHFTGMVGSRTGVPMVLVYDGRIVRLHIAELLAIAWPRQELAAALVATVQHESIRVWNDLVVIDHPGGLLPLHLVVELAEVEDFLDETFTADPERVDEAELAAVLAGA